MKNETIKDDALLEEDISEEETEERRRRLIVLILFFLVLILGVFMLSFTRSNISEPVIGNLCYYDCDILNIGVPNYRVDNTGDKKPNTNLGPIGGNRPVYNVTYGKLYREAHFNMLIDPYDVDEINYNADNRIFNPVTNPNSNGTTTGLFNVDINNDGWPEINIDFEGKGVCNLNCDLNGDGIPDKRIDVDWDAICDLYCEDETLDNPEIQKPDVKPDVDVKDDKTYILVFEDLDDENEFIAVPGWSGKKTFTVTNTGTGPVTYKIVFTKVKNTFTEINNLNYGLTFDGNIVKDINENRAPYENGELISGIEIMPGQIQTYTISFEFRDTGLNQDIDKDKIFYTKLQVRNMNE